MPQSGQTHQIIKILFIGDALVGKSSIVDNWTRGTAAVASAEEKADYRATTTYRVLSSPITDAFSSSELPIQVVDVGGEYFTHVVSARYVQTCTTPLLGIHAAHLSYSSEKKRIYSGSTFVFIVYDITSSKSFHSAVSRSVNAIQSVLYFNFSNL